MVDSTTQGQAQPVDQKQIKKVVKQAAQQPIGQEQTQTPQENSEPMISGAAQEEAKPKLKVPAKQPVVAAQPQPVAQPVVTPPAQAPVTPQPAQTPAVQQPVKNKKLKWWIWLIFGVVLIAAGVGLYFWIF
jgi:hypothetical protein